jgi:hypothetical protein
MNEKRVLWIEIKRQYAIYNFHVKRSKKLRLLFKQMPQFDIFSFFSQLFWVLIGFSYLYLLLSFYILPAFAAVLKIRAKKLSQVNIAADSSEIAIKPVTNIVFFENLSVKLNTTSLVRPNLINEINTPYNSLILKNEAFLKFNSLLLNNFKTISFFA